MDSNFLRLSLLFALVAAVVPFRLSLRGTVISEEQKVLSHEHTTIPRVRIISYEPFVVHISNFLEPWERQHLMGIGSSRLERSTVLYANGSRALSDERTSSTAYLPRDDEVVQAIFERAAEFQGYLPLESLDMQITSYQPGQQYRAHYDWFTEPNRTNNRLSTFFATLEADCTNCGTEFPNIHVDWSRKDERWCEVVDCTKSVLTTKNIPGSAIYWRNLNADAEGRVDTLHAGLPALNGSKVGLNIWTDVNVVQFRNEGKSSPFYQAS